MIQANELRIGNYYDDNGQYEKVTPNVIEHVFISQRSWVKPIPITPEILEKAGFEKYGKPAVIPFAWFRNGVAITSNHPEGVIISADENDNIVQSPIEFECHFYSAYGTNIHLKHLHQLQNLYFALTGEELEINL